jgi:hypothetical protein
MAQDAFVDACVMVGSQESSKGSSKGSVADQTSRHARSPTVATGLQFGAS